MNRDEFPPLAQLEATPAILAGILAAVTDDEMAWKPSEQRWSVSEVLAHLCHVELLGMRERVERMVAEENPDLPGYDPAKHEAAGVYGRRWRLKDALGEFEQERTRSLHLLRSVPVAALERPGTHRELGPITVRNLLNEWALHDLGHIRQIAELVRAVKYFPGIGVWQKFYTLHP